MASLLYSTINNFAKQQLRFGTEPSKIWVDYSRLVRHLKKMKLQTIEQTIQINATAEKVWQILWDKDHYKKWAAAFMPGSHYTGDLKQDGRIQFLGPDNNGMESNVESITENREITFHHLHELEAGKEGRSLGNMREKYWLDEQDSITTLSVSSDMPEEYFSEMDTATKKALQIIKELAEE